MPRVPMTGIAVCAFDAYGTLFNLGAMASLCERTLGDRGRALIQDWRHKQLEYTWLRSLMGRHTDFWHIIGESLDYAMKAMGVDDPVLRSRLMETYLAPTAFPDAKPCLEAMAAAGHRLAILSNASPSMLLSATKATGIDHLLEAVLSIEEAGVFKPHPSAYGLVPDRFECQPAQVAFISTNGWDAAGAGAFGFRVIWVNRRGLPHDILPASPHATVDSLVELPDLLQP